MVMAMYPVVLSKDTRHSCVVVGKDALQSNHCPEGLRQMSTMLVLFASVAAVQVDRNGISSLRWVGILESPTSSCRQV